MSAPELLAGSVVAGKYTIRSLLLHGEATATYRAVAAKNRDVALKIYDPAILKFPDVLKAIALHQSVSAKLTSREIIRISDSGTEANWGAPFTVTDFEPGPTLLQLLDRGPLSVSDASAMIRNLARATDLLHSNGVESLSLHPTNVFVSPGTPYETRVADFGASLVRRVLPVTEKAGRWMPWLAPEQIKGQVAPGPAADIFALGLLAFFAVTGKLYWRASQVKAPDLAALRREILAERMPASVRASEYSINLNPAVDAVFARALGFRPADRYATAREFAVALDAALTGRSIAEADAAEAPAVPADDASARRNAPPPPRKMPMRSTMLGMGSPPPDTSAARPPARPPMGTMLGIGEPTETKAAPSPKIAPPAASTKGAPTAKIATPAVPTPAVKVGPPAMPTQSLKSTTLGMSAPAARIATPAVPTPAVKVAPPAMPTPPAAPTQSLKATAFGMPAPAMKIPTPALPTPAVKVAPPAMPASPAKVTPPMSATAAFTSAQAPIAYAKPHAPAPIATAMPAEPPVVVASSASTDRRGPPALPMTPPPTQMADVLTRFEAEPSPLTVTAFTASPSARTDVVQGAPAWPAPGPNDLAGERVETGVAVIGANFADTPAPKNSRVRWIAAACGLLFLTGGGAWALSGRKGSGPGDAASPTPSANATVPSPTGIAAQKPAEEAPPSAALEPAAPAAPAPEAPEVPVADTAEPAAPSAPAEEPPPPAGDPNAAPQAPTAPGIGAAPHPQPSKKNCGKFLKRCK
jgi:serine/threonine protein kinase